jgi:tRNA(Ile)-lysidine synthase TilS/MesJ
MFSGGLDSTGMLYKLLTAPEYQDYSIHAHHVILKNSENRDAAESLAVKVILTKFARLGLKLTYSESAIDVRFLKFTIPDVITFAFIAGNICAAKNIEHVAVGRVKEDLNNRFLLRSQRGQEVFNAVKNGRTGTYFRPLENFSKKEIWNFLPASIRKLVWWCRRPIYDNNGNPNACGYCKSCQQMKKVVKK